MAMSDKQFLEFKTNFSLWFQKNNADAELGTRLHKFAQGKEKSAIECYAALLTIQGVASHLPHAFSSAVTQKQKDGYLLYMTWLADGAKEQINVGLLNKGNEKPASYLAKAQAGICDPKAKLDVAFASILAMTAQNVKGSLTDVKTELDKLDKSAYAKMSNPDLAYTELWLKSGKEQKLGETFHKAAKKCSGPYNEIECFAAVNTYLGKPSNIAFKYADVPQKEKDCFLALASWIHPKAPSSLGIDAEHVEDFQGDVFRDVVAVEGVRKVADLKTSCVRIGEKVLEKIQPAVDKFVQQKDFKDYVLKKHGFAVKA